MREHAKLTAEKKIVLKEKKVEKRRIVLEGLIDNDNGDGEDNIAVKVKKERKKKQGDNSYAILCSDVYGLIYCIVLIT